MSCGTSGMTGLQFGHACCYARLLVLGHAVCWTGWTRTRTPHSSLTHSAPLSVSQGGVSGQSAGTGNPKGKPLVALTIHDGCGPVRLAIDDEINE